MKLTWPDPGRPASGRGDLRLQRLPTGPVGSGEASGFQLPLRAAARARAARSLVLGPAGLGWGRRAAVPRFRAPGPGRPAAWRSLSSPRPWTAARPPFKFRSAQLHEGESTADCREQSRGALSQRTHGKVYCQRAEIVWRRPRRKRRLSWQTDVCHGWPLSMLWPHPSLPPIRFGSAATVTALHGSFRKQPRSRRTPAVARCARRCAACVHCGLVSCAPKSDRNQSQSRPQLRECATVSEASLGRPTGDRLAGHPARRLGAALLFCV